MRLRGIRLPLLAAVVWAGIGLTVYATDYEYRETIYVNPTSTTISLSPTYAVSRSYVVPTDYVIPSYIPTSASYFSTSYYAEPLSVLPTSYVATTYRRGLLGRRWLVERPLAATYGVAYVPSALVVPSLYPTTYRVTSYRPTAWQYPSVWPTAYTSAATICCDEVALAAPSQSSSSSPIVSSSASRAAKANDSAKREDAPISSAVDPAPDGLAPIAPLPDAQKNKPQSDTASTPRGDTPPPTPAPPAKPDPAAAQSNPANATQPATPKEAAPKAGDTGTPAKDKKTTPAASDGNQDQQPLLPAPEAPGDEGIRRDAYRPPFSERARRVQRRNILFGTIQSDSGAPREEVPVSVVSRTNSLIHHDGISDAFGTFAISVPDGDWTIKVTQPSGRVSSVRSFTVKNGKVLDNLEAREIYNLIISF